MRFVHSHSLPNAVKNRNRLRKILNPQFVNCKLLAAYIYPVMDKFGMYKKIPMSGKNETDEAVLNEARDYTAAPDYSAASPLPRPDSQSDAQSRAQYNAQPHAAAPETPEQVGRRIATAAGSGTAPQPIPQKRAVTAAQRAYFDMQRRHARLSDEIDRKHKSQGNGE
jgi:hypothetical protein